MTQTKLRPAADQSGSGLGIGICSAALSNPEFTAPTLGGQGTVSLQAYRLQRRFGLNAATAKLLSSHAFGNREDDLGDWVSLADAAAAAIDTAARAMEARS